MKKASLTKKTWKKSKMIDCDRIEKELNDKENEKKQVQMQKGKKSPN